MSKKAKQYSATEKTKIVLEAIKAEMTIAQISSKYGVHSTQIQIWKKRGIENPWCPNIVEPLVCLAIHLMSKHDQLV